MAIAGLVTVGLAVSAAVPLVASFVTGGLITGLIACMFGLLWFAFPLTRR